MPAARVTGTLAAAVTPLREGGRRLDEDAFGPLLDFYADGGLDGVLMLGTTGEGLLLGQEERRRAVELAAAVAGPLAIMVHCGAQTTAETRALAAHAAEAGADAVLVIGPPYFPLSERELLAHFAAAAEACAPLPFYLYEYAERNCYAIPPTLIDELRECAPNLVGMKVSDAPFERVEQYLASGLDIFVGAEGCIRDGLAHGAVGAASGVAAAFPEAVAALVNDPTDERASVVGSLRQALSAYPFQAAVKAALGARGVAVRPEVRAPLLPLAADQLETLRERLERAWSRNDGDFVVSRPRSHRHA
jgi:dihydrodipicolinate synthase/N-acetylneuraminate lyase